MSIFKRSAFVERLVIAFFITIGVGLIAIQSVAAPDKRNVIGRSPLGRFLLVASEGLYVVEPDGSSSWAYHPAPLGQQVRGMEDDIIYDGCPLSNGHYLFSTHRYIRNFQKNTIFDDTYVFLLKRNVKNTFIGYNWSF